MIPPEKNLSDPSLYRVSTADPITLLPLCVESMIHWIRRYPTLRPEYTFPLTTFKDLSDIRLSYSDTISVLALAFFFTIFRYFCQWKAQDYVQSHSVFPRFAHKIPESCWKLLYYGLSWLFSLYIHTCISSIDIFHDPLSMWKDFAGGKIPQIEPTVYIVYLTQASFYLHSIYATLFMDLWRKDSWLMFTHHFIALALLCLSYVDGYTLAGALTLFLQDNTDALLEMVKLAMYLKKRIDGRFYKSLYYFGNVVFITFVLAWIIFRLYWYPCKLLYATLYGGVYLGPQDGRFMPQLGIMLILIYAMNVYWFNFIIRMAWRVASTGEDPEDNREYDTTAVSGLDQQHLDQLAVKQRKSKKKD